MNLVISGSHEQFLSRLNNKEETYIGNIPNDLYGHIDCNLILDGTWYAHKDYDDNFIQGYCLTHNIKIIR